MRQKQELKDQKPESSVEHEIKSSSTSEASQLPADSHDMKQLETYRSTQQSQVSMSAAAVA
jgi:citrate synthase